MQELEEEYERARPLLKDALRAAGWTASPDADYGAFIDALQGAASEGAAAAAAGGEADKQQQQQQQQPEGADTAKVAAVRDSLKRAYYEEQVSALPYRSGLCSPLHPPPPPTHKTQKHCMCEVLARLWSMRKSTRLPPRLPA